MGEKVVSLRSGQAITLPGEPNPNVIKLLEDLLERALSGDLAGVGVVLHFADDSHGYSVAGVCNRATIGTAELLKLDLCKAEEP